MEVVKRWVILKRFFLSVIIGDVADPFSREFGVFFKISKNKFEKSQHHGKARTRPTVALGAKSKGCLIAVQLSNQLGLPSSAPMSASAKTPSTARTLSCSS